MTVIITALVYVLLTRLNTQRNDALFFFLAIKKDVLHNLQERLMASEELDRNELTEEEKEAERLKKEKEEREKIEQ